MSNIGIAANLFQPSGKCLKCRHWNPATKDFMGNGTDGHFGEDILIERNYYGRFKVVFKNYLDHDWRRLICFYMVGNAIGSQLL